MNFAFAIVTLFPGGGLQRDCMAIASRLAARGHQVTIFAERARGALPAALSVKLLPNRAWTNHGRDQTFADDVVRSCRGRFDRLVGFGKLKDLDRAAAALREFPEARLLIAGVEPKSKHGRTVQRWARQNSVHDRIKLLGLRNDIPQLMAAADLLVHPARYDTTGTVILESLV